MNRFRKRWERMKEAEKRRRGGGVIFHASSDSNSVREAVGGGGPGNELCCYLLNIWCVSVTDERGERRTGGCTVHTRMQGEVTVTLE